MSTDTALSIALAALSCYWGFHIGRIAAREHPLTWGVVFGVALMGCVGWILGYIAASSHEAMLPMTAAYFVAITIGANRGTVWRQRKNAADRDRERRLLAWLATLGPCVECGSGDLQRRPCDNCGSVYCASCSLKHQPYVNGTESRCPQVTT